MVLLVLYMLNVDNNGSIDGLVLIEKLNNPSLVILIEDITIGYVSVFDRKMCYLRDFIIFKERIGILSYTSE